MVHSYFIMSIDQQNVDTFSDALRSSTSFYNASHIAPINYFFRKYFRFFLFRLFYLLTLISVLNLNYLPSIGRLATRAFPSDAVNAGYGK